jgi:phage gpG-like protein
MAQAVTFTFWGDRQLDRTIADREERADDYRPAWDVLAERFRRMEVRQFRSEGRYGSGGWAPLNPRYRAWKARRYPGKTILRRTDELFRSLTERPFGVEVLERHVMVVGSDVDYGEHHQRGTPRMPQRRPVEMPESERREWVKTIQRFLVTGRPT